MYGRGRSYGTFRFSHPPSPGDRIVAGNSYGENDLLRVVYVEHHPVRLPVGRFDRRDPYVSIVVEYAGSHGD